MSNQRSTICDWHPFSRMPVLALLFFLIASPGFSQLETFSLPKGQSVSTKQKTNARSQALTPMPLPFFDDFSDPYFAGKGLLYPDPNRWENSYDVWVNTGIGINAPTVNVATFDGLDSAGAAYNSTDIFLNGYTDSLVSRAIDLTPSSTNPVTTADRPSVFLSFFYEYQGNGEIPDEKDFIEVQFRNNSNKWVTQATLKIEEGMTGGEFYTKILPVTGDEFFHGNFQFRFRSYGRLSGPYDTWNIDYVYLNKGRNANDLAFPDKAAASSLTPLFAPYWSVPYLHFLAAPTMQTVHFDVKNLKNFNSSTNFSAGIKAFHYKNNQLASTYDNLVIPSRAVKDPSGNLEPFERASVAVDLSPIQTPAVFDPDADSVDIKTSVRVISTDEEEADRAKFLPFDLRVNDTVSTTYRLHNYYAYDDGVAEYAAGLIQSGNVVAYRFDLPTGLNDTLKILEGFEIYFPPFGLTANQTVDFLIFQDNNGVPASEGLLTIPSRHPENKGVNGFQRFIFLPSLQITGDKFYIGWRQPLSGKVLVGLDNSNDTGDRMFFNTEGSVVPKEEFWQPNNAVKGSLMIRPIMGTGVVDITTGIDDEPDFSIYPNPSKGSFIINGIAEDVQLLSISGQRVQIDVEQENDRTLVNVKNGSIGLYILRYRQGTKIRAQKVILTQ